MSSAFFFWYMYTEIKSKWNGESWEHELYWLVGMISAVVLFMLSFLSFMLVYCKDPGYSKSVAIDKFAEILDQAIKDGRNLDYFCFFCRSLWSSSSVHCMTCGRCVEGFDHHCVFVNNCVGYRNHANFLFFVMLSFLYTIILIFNSSWTIYEKVYHCE